MKKLVFLGLFTLMAGITYAGGYRTSLQGQRALAMGHAGVAVVNSAELVFFNPAGLVYLEDKLNVSVGAVGIISKGKYQNFTTNQESETTNDTSIVPSLYISYALNEYFALGLGVYAPYGSTISWEKDWIGSHLVNEISLSAIYINPTISIKLADVFSIGGGPLFAIGSVDFNRNLSRTLTDINGTRSNVTVEDSGISGVGYKAGFMFTPHKDFRVGMTYMSEIVLEVDSGDATFSNTPDIAGFPDSDKFSAELPAPAELVVGLAYQVTDKFLFAFDYNRTFWSAYKSLDITFASITDPTRNPSVNPRNYKNSSVYRFGLQYDATEKITLRAGYYHDETPVQLNYFSPETPRPDADGFTGGLTFNINEHFAIDASFLYLNFEETTASYEGYEENGVAAPFEGTYIANAFIPGIGITYKL